MKTAYMWDKVLGGNLVLPRMIQ